MIGYHVSGPTTAGVPTNWLAAPWRVASRFALGLAAGGRRGMRSIERAEQYAQQRVVQMNLKVETNLLAIITTLASDPRPACQCNSCDCGCGTERGDEHAS
jgi:hypothetical protein